MIVCDFCGDEDTVWEGDGFALCLDDCRKAIVENMASPEQKLSIEKALKDIGEQP